MINLVAHRGFWKSKAEQNTKVAIQRALKNNYDVEVDIRDHKNELVISHDPVKGNQYEILPRDIFKNNTKCLFFLDLKASELQKMILSLKFKNFVVFDAAIPDLYKYYKLKIPYLVRWSDLESLEQNIISKAATGICIDSFTKSILTKNTLITLSKKFKIVFVISDELHGKSQIKQWKMLKREIKLNSLTNVYLCTDKLLEADLFFND